jgi:hypothetical protein
MREVFVSEQEYKDGCKLFNSFSDYNNPEALREHRILAEKISNWYFDHTPSEQWS